MAKTATNVSNFQINVLTEAQYIEAMGNGEIDENALYLTPEKKLIKSVTQAEYDALKKAGKLDDDILYVTPAVEINDATQSEHGYMSATDKIKLDGIATGANKTVVDNALSQVSANPVANSAITKWLQYLYSFKISRDKWNESSDKSNWNVIVPWSDSSGTALTGSTAGTPNLTTGMSLGPAMMERTSSLSDNIILSGELSMINQGQIYVCDTNKLSFTVKRRPVCDLMLYFYARQWTT